MRKTIGLLATGLLVGAVAAPASAAIYSTTFTGTVTGQQGTTYSIGSTVTGSFVYSSDSNRFLSYSIDSFSASGNYQSITSAGPGSNPYSAMYETLISAAQQGGNLNQSFDLDLEALTNFTAATPLAILATPAINSQIDPTYSTFAYNSDASNGTGVVSLTASLNQVTTQVPEPTTLVLLAAPLVGLVMRRRR